MILRMADTSTSTPPCLGELAERVFPREVEVERRRLQMVAAEHGLNRRERDPALGREDGERVTQDVRARRPPDARARGDPADDPLDRARGHGHRLVRGEVRTEHLDPPPRHPPPPPLLLLPHPPPPPPPPTPPPL